MPFVVHLTMSVTPCLAPCDAKHEFVEEAEENDFRLVFEIKFVKQLFDDYKPFKLMIWRTFTDTNLRALLALDVNKYRLKSDILLIR